MVTCMHSRTCMRGALIGQSAAFAVVRPHCVTTSYRPALPAARMRRHAVRQSGRCRATENGKNEEGEPQQQGAQLVEDAKQAVEESGGEKTLGFVGNLIMWTLLSVRRIC
jgi:hypothetical protein